jgi:hypothetical protein
LNNFRFPPGPQRPLYPPGKARPNRSCSPNESPKRGDRQNSLPDPILGYALRASRPLRCDHRKDSRSFGPYPRRPHRTPEAIRRESESADRISSPFTPADDRYAWRAAAGTDGRCHPPRPGACLPRGRRRNGLRSLVPPNDSPPIRHLHRHDRPHTP